MLFVEPRFFVFFLAVAALYWSLPGNRPRKLLLLGASYLFYAAWDWRFLSLILASSLIDYLVAWRLDLTERPGTRRVLLTLSLVSNLGLLGFFKYFHFFEDSLVQLLARFGIEMSHTTLHIVLPVGISFYTFQTLSYTIDVYRGSLKAERDFLDVALFVAFFPQLVAGPIVRAAEFLPQLSRPRRREDVAVRSCLALFLVGFFKKACVSDNVAPFVDRVFQAPAGFSAMAVWTGVALYAVQIYCDFSGYSDMAIASAGLLGFQLPENFRAPYFATSITDFWRRWHISLSTWLRDYLYIALGGNRRGRVRTYLNLMLTMLLGGLWHGAAWNFVIWGGLHGSGLAFHRRWRDRPVRWKRLRALAGWLLTLGFVLLAWIFFRAESLGRALEFLRTCVTFESPGTQVAPLILLAALPVLAGVHWLSWRHRWLERVAGLRPAAFALALGIGFAVAVALVHQGHRPFIYFQF